MCGLQSALFFFAVLFGLSASAQVVQDDWIAPALPDFSTTITIGTSYTIKWTQNLYAWFPQFASSANVTDVDLWVTTSNSAKGQILIQSGINVNQTQFVNWVVSISPEQLTISADWTFRFLPAGSAFTSVQGQQISSPGVVVRAASASSTTSSASTSTTASTSSTSSTTTSAALASTTASAPASGGASSLSSGAIAGISIGAVAVAVMSIGLFFFLRYKKRAQLSPKASGAQYTPASTEFTAKYPASVQRVSYFPPSELEGSSR